MTKPLDAHRRKVLSFIEDAGLTMVEAAVRIGRNRAYLQQYITRGVPRELHERDRKSLAILLGIAEDDLRTPEALSSFPTPRPNANVITQLRTSDKGPADLPIKGRRGTREGLNVLLDLDQRGAGHTDRPAILMGSRDGFAFYVPDDDVPGLPLGAKAFVDPAKPARDGDFVLIQLKDGSGIVGKLLSNAPDSVTVSRNGPKDTLETPRNSIETVFKIVGADFP